MLRKISNVQQESGERVKYWFTSSTMDVFVWLNSNQRIESFQCSYNKAISEKALIWSCDRGFSRVAVDDGARPGSYPLSPIYIADDSFDSSSLVTLFEKEVGTLESDILQDVIKIIRQN